MRTILFIFGISLFWITSTLFAQHNPPNLVFILTDDLGYGDLACYGHPIIHTPNLDKLAKEGLRLTHFYSPSPLCSPSRAGMLTGRTPFRTGIKSWIPEGTGVYLKKEEITLATLLRAKGYQTYMSGKWHLNDGLGKKEIPQPEDHGFEHWMALHAFPIPHHRNTRNFYENGKPLGPIEGYSAAFTINKALDFLDHREKDQPFFLYVPMNEPHGEIASPPEFTDMYKEFTRGAPNPDSLAYRGPGEYYANITYLDAQIGRLLDRLDRLNLRENTIVIFTSDNGPVTSQWRHPWEVNLFGSTGGLRGRKGDLYEGGIRVPFMIRYPGYTAEGSFSDVPVHGYDLLPTLCTLLDIEIPNDRIIDGINIASLLKGIEPKRDNPLFWAFDLQPEQDPPGYSYAVREGDWKLITDQGLRQTLLYNLSSDPHEVRDLSKQQPALVKRLLKEVGRMVESIGLERRE